MCSGEVIFMSMYMLRAACAHRTGTYSRSYAEDVTSVTSGASQGPHSFNLVFVCLFVCLFVCVTPGTIPYLYRTVPYQQRQLATICLFVCAIDMPGAIPYLARTIKSTVPSRE